MMYVAGGGGGSKKSCVYNYSRKDIWTKTLFPCNNRKRSALALRSAVQHAAAARPQFGSRLFSVLKDTCCAEPAWSR